VSIPSNADIMNKLIEISTSQAVQQDQLTRVEAQAIKTNGRVNSIEEWKTGLLAVASYQKEHPNSANQTINAPNARTVQVVPNKWFQSKELVGTVGLIGAAIAAAIGFWAGGAS
jgi:hypothetical protein